MSASYLKQAEQLLTEAGFKFHRMGKGSHRIYRDDQGNQTTLTTSKKSDFTKLKKIASDIKRMQRSN